MRTVDIKARNGEFIKTFLYGQEKTKDTVIMCHGFSGDSSGIFNPALVEGLSNDYFVCRFDFRGSGQSQGEFSTTTITRELEDLDTVVKWIKKEYGQKRLILIGHSFGAVITTLYAAKNNVHRLILLAGEGDLEKAINLEFSTTQQKELATTGKTQVENWSRDGKKDYLNRGFLDDMRKYSTKDAMAKVTAPTLFIHGSKDDVIPPEASVEMCSLTKAKKEIVILDNVDHVFNFFTEQATLGKVIENIHKWVR